MPVSLEVVKKAIDEVKALYQKGCDLAKAQGCAKPAFNELIRAVVRGMFLSDVERADLIHELAKFFGRRGGKKKPRKPRAKKPKVQKPPKPKKAKKPQKANVKAHPTSEPISRSLLMDCFHRAQQGHESQLPDP